MAVPATSISLLGFEAWVTCEGARVPVYNVEVNGNKATCWIPSETGKAFAVHSKMLDKTCATTVTAAVSVDGWRVKGLVLGSKPPEKPQHEGSASGARTGPTTSHNLCFSSLSTSDDDRAMKDGALLANLGTIRVEVYRVALGKLKPRIIHAVPEHLQSGLTVDEKAKKLGGHHATLAAGQHVKPRKTWSTKRLDPAGVNCVEFEFKYRPKEVLQAQDIIPVERQATPPPQPTKRARDTSALDNSTNARPAKKHKKPKDEPLEDVPVDEDPAVLRARIRDLEAQLGQRDIKPKVEPIRFGDAFTSGQVIDLSEDD